MSEELLPDEKQVRFRDPVDQAGFTQIPNVILCDSRLKVGARFLYCHLARFAWEEDSCYPGQDRLAGEIGMSHRAIRLHTKELEAAGLISIERRGQGKTNLYFLNGPDRQKRAHQDLPILACKEDTGKEDTASKKRTKESDPRTREVFDYWQSTLNRERSKLTPTRRTKIEARLKAGATVQEIKRAIDGCAGSEFHTGQGHVDLTLICRSDEKLEFFQGMPKPEGDEDFFAGTGFES